MFTRSYCGVIIISGGVDKVIGCGDFKGLYVSIMEFRWKIEWSSLRF